MRMDARSSNKRSISKLPDAILQRILSFLPTKDAVKTSVLSRRWEYLWTSIPNLEFIGGASDNFTAFVDRVIALHVSDIKKCWLECYKSGDEPCIKRLIAAVVRRNVEELHIDTEDPKGPLQLPQCLFVSASLTRLNLSICCTLKFPPSIRLSNLKNLLFEHITFTDDVSTQQFFSGCPALETVCFYKCKWTNLCSVVICAPKLWSLEVIGDKGANFEASDGCELMIFAPSLHYFDYDGEFLNDYCIYDSPTLNEAKIHSRKAWNERPRTVFYRLYKLLKGISNVKQLSLSSDTVEVFAFLSCCNKNSFHHLSGKSEDHRTIDCEALMKMLQCSPRLENLCFKAGIKLSLHCKNYKGISESVTQGFLSRLKTVEIDVSKFGGNEKLFVDAIEILLKRASVLDKLIVYVPKYYAATVGVYKEKLKKELLKLPKASKLVRSDYANFLRRSFLKYVKGVPKQNMDIGYVVVMELM
ncbi:putative FBD-associated F-box protein At5g56700 [Tripterygium wilfordii]|uniref:putative FBD-associated F-box protein At5g56700 n=1 Tax=Tripterygium wilfordii TaxID=458696 RepID=UPI0018F7EAA5|nr:putative FBD-associated F-box protein At5g56700 [Tripterygium wilfordii]